MDLNTYGANQGIGALVQSAEVQVWAGPIERQIFSNIQLISSAVDAGNTPTTTLRGGLILGKITASGLYKAYNPVGTDGAEVADCVLYQGVSMLDPSGVARQTKGMVIVSGILDATTLLNLDNQARRQLIQSGKFIFADDSISKPAFLGLPIREIPKTADYTVVAADNGTMFTTAGAAGAVNFTLPAIAQGLAFEFLNLVDQNMTITSAEGDNIVLDHDASADSLAFSTASHKIGGHVVVFANAAGTKWYVRVLSPPTCTITAAT